MPPIFASFSGSIKSYGLIRTGLLSAAVSNTTTIVIQRFTSSAGWIAPVGVANIEYLIVAGGGAGGGPSSAGTGGGGAGGYLANPNYPVTTGQLYTFTVGAGGSTNSGAPSSHGSNSTLTSPAPGFSTIIAYGGGRGGEGGDEAGIDSAAGGMPYGPTPAPSPSQFGSGGGAGRGGYPLSFGVPGQGNYGGDGQNLPYLGGGGGGAGTGGGTSPGSPKSRGNGGDGLNNSITGTPVGYAGGGGGNGGGGATSFGGGNPSSAGTTNTGGGGGAYANGGSGVAIIKYSQNTSSYPGITSQSFTATGSTSWTAPAGITSVQYLVVAGGGGGGYWHGGGGGGGGVRFGFSYPVTPGATYSIAVGGGGAAPSGGPGVPIGGQGGSSTFDTITASGGGGGGSRYGPGGGDGGSGGGGGYFSGNGNGNVPSVSPPQGTAGGPGGAHGGGGGGAGEPGFPSAVPGYPLPYPSPYSSPTDGGGKGGGGLVSTITGSSVAYGGGGGGGDQGPGTLSRGGNGGGANGTATGTTNTGGGGGGAGGTPIAAGNGGSGIVILRYGELTANPPVSGYIGWYTADSWTGTQWNDLSGNGNHATTIRGTISKVSTTGNGATGTFNTLQGGTGDGLRFPSAILPATYTLFHVTRTTGGTRARIVTGSNNNWLSGHWGGGSGIAFHEGWLTDQSDRHSNQWFYSTDQNSLYRSNGVTRGTSGGSASTALTINYGTYSEYSDWQCAEVLVYSSALSDTDYQSVETWLAAKYGI